MQVSEKRRQVLKKAVCIESLVVHGKPVFPCVLGILVFSKVKDAKDSNDSFFFYGVVRDRGRNGI